MPGEEGGTGEGHVLDVHVQGRGIRRSETVALRQDGLRAGDETVPTGQVLWTARRAGLLLVFCRDRTLALRGGQEDLDALSRGLSRRVDPEEQRKRLLGRVAGEEVLFAAGTAVRGRLEDDPVAGLHVAVCTPEALHLFAEDRHRVLPFPADEVEVGRDPSSGRKRVVLRRGDAHLSLLYLEPEERRQAVRAAGSEEGTGQGSLELFSQREVAPPPPAEIPELSRAAGSLQPAARREAEAVPESDRSAFRPHFFEMHFLELGEIALGPLLLRKSAASGARSLERAVGSLDADELQDATRAAVERATGRLVEVYREELERLAGEKRASARRREELDLSEDERAEITARVQAPFDKLAPRFRRLEQEQVRLETRLETVAEGPPGEEDPGVPEAADSWREVLAELDRGYEQAWAEALEELRRTWTSTLIPRLADLRSMKRRRVPEWLKLALIAAGTLLLVGAVVLLLAG